jgi:hypothetical protein
VNLKLRNPWDVIGEYGHTALRLLKIAHDSEIEAARNTANMEAFPVGAEGFVALVNRNQFLATDMFRMFTASIIMFQSMMDAAMQEALKMDSRLAEAKTEDTFQGQWERAFAKLKKDPESLAKYNTDIYQRFVTPMTNLTRNSLGAFQHLNTATIYQGFACGWDAYAQLSRGLGMPLDDDSWATISRTHGLPESLAI